MKDLLRQRYQYFTELNLTSLVILFYLYRMAIPAFKFPFLLLYFLIILYAILANTSRIVSTLRTFFQNYYLLICLAIILIICFLLSNKLYLTISKDIINAIILLSLFYIMSLFIITKRDLSHFFKISINLIIIFSLVISIISLANLFNLFPDSATFLKNENFSSNVSGAPQIDYNFATLPILFGVICIFYNLTRANSFLNIIFYNLTLVFSSLNIFFSGSKRGMICFLVIVIMLILAHVVSIFKKDFFPSKMRSRFLFFFLSLVSIALLLFYFTFYTSSAFKNRTLEFMGTKNLLVTKTKISLIMFRYISVFDKNNSYSDIFNKIWTPYFDAKDPDSSWGTRTHKTIFNLTGQNVGMIPKGVKGYYMDSTCNADTWDGNAYSFTPVGYKIKVKKGNIIRASVFCYVSNDYNGDWVRIVMGGSEGLERWVTLGENYNLLSSETWQKLTCNVTCKDDVVDVYLYFSKTGVNDFSTLKGHVIFAYPKVEIFENKDSVLSYLDCFRSVVRMSNKFNSSVDMLNNDINKIRYMEKISKSFESINSVNVVQDIHSSFHNRNIEFNNDKLITSFPNSVKYNSMGLLNINIPLLTSIIQPGNDTDPFRAWISRFISEDTTYYPLKYSIISDTLSNRFIDDRVFRWRFAFKILSEEYNWKQKLFGGGFNFLNWYGYYFDNDKTRSDYPHNPFLSVLLYSGILGLIIYLIFMYKVFYYYIKYFKEYKILAVFFIITFFFSFFSAGSPFDPPIMGFFVILPFFIHSIHRKSKSSEQ